MTDKHDDVSHDIRETTIDYKVNGNIVSNSLREKIL